MKFLSDILAKAGLTVDGVVTLNNTATGQTPNANDNSTKLATTAWVRTFVQPYSLPIASDSILGGIKVGSGLAIDASTGVLTATGGVTASNVRNIQKFTATAGQTVFTITSGYVPGLIDIFVNGVKLDNSGDFTATNGSTVTLTNAVLLNDIVEAYCYINTFAANNALRTSNSFIATAGQTTFTVDYNPGFIDVFYNGSKLVAAEYTATNGTSVVFNTACILNDLVEIISYTYSVNGFTGVSSARTLTINGTTYDLSENRTWSITNASLGAQPQLNGTGLVRMSGTTVSYDNATYATQSYVTTAVANLVNSAPSTLDTLNELATALGNDANFATTIATSIGTKQNQLNGTGFVKISGTTISYDNSTYLTISLASSTYLGLTGGTLTGDLVVKQKITAGDGTTNAGLYINRGSSANDNAVRFQTAGTNNWFLGSAATASNTDMQLYNYGLSGAAMTILYSNNFVGLGTVIPGRMLEISYPGPGLRLRYNADNYMDFESDFMNQVSTGANSWQFQFNGTPSIQFNSNGSIGIGSVGYASTKLLVRGQDSTSSNWSFITEDSGTNQIFGIRNDGRIGILTGNPLTPFHVVKDGTSGYSATTYASSGILLSRTIGGGEQLGMRITGASQNGISGTNYAGQFLSDGNNIFEIYTTSGSPLILGTNATERFRLNGTTGAATFTSSITSTQFNAVNDRNYLARGGFRVTSSSNNASTLDISVTDTTTNIYSNYYSGGNDNTLIIGTYANNTNQLVLKPSGNILMGMVSEGVGKLQVNGIIRSTELRLGNSYTASYTTTTDWQTAFQTLIPTGVLVGEATYLITIRWYYGGGSYSPYYAFASTIFNAVATNQGTATGNEVDLLTSTHVNSNVILRVATLYGVNTISGLAIKCVNFSTISGGNMTVSATRIQ